MPVNLTKRNHASRISLYLETHRGPGGRVLLPQWLHKNPKTPAEKRHNADALILAERRRSEAETEQLYHDTDLPVPHKLSGSILSYFEGFRKTYNKKDYKKVDAAIKQWRLFQGDKTISFAELNENTVNDFKEYLSMKTGSSETARAYFTKFKYVLKRAKIDKCCRYDIKTFEGKISIKKTLQKEVLEQHEIQMLAKTKCDNQTIKLAFIFCCFTGLDFTDMFHLQWNHIKNNTMKKPRNKTDIDRFTPLHPTAVNVLALLDPDTPFVFQDLPNREKKDYCNAACNKTLKALVIRADIQKHITWHCARHSFGTNAEGDEGTIAQLLGHSDTKMVKVYRRIKEDRLKLAVNSLQGVTIK